MSDAHGKPNPIRSLFHIRNDMEWKSVSAESILKADMDPIGADPSIPTSGNCNDDSSSELTIRKIMQDLESTSDPEKIWKDKGHKRILMMANNNANCSIEKKNADTSHFAIGTIR